jgi:hypothetical protein
MPFFKQASTAPYHNSFPKKNLMKLDEIKEGFMTFGSLIYYKRPATKLMMLTPLMVYVEDFAFHG